MYTGRWPDDQRDWVTPYIPVRDIDREITTTAARPTTTDVVAPGCECPSVAFPWWIVVGLLVVGSRKRR
jgi:hypothetical protein